MRKFRIKQVSEDEFIPQTKKTYQLFWRTIWWGDCESLSFFDGFTINWGVGSKAKAMVIIDNFKAIQKEKESIKNKYPINHYL
jgi:hypothetical protein